VRILTIILILLGSITISAQQVINAINIEGNFRTQEYIILRELKFEEGDTTSQQELTTLLNESKNNLLLTALFNMVNFTVTPHNTTEIDIKITVQERWYFWIYPIFEFADRNFDTYFFNKQWNRINYGLSFEKHNFRGRNELLNLKIRLGYKQQYSFYYFVPYIDRNKNHGMWIGYDHFNQKEMAYNIENYQYNYINNTSTNIYFHNQAQAGYQYRITSNFWIKNRFSYNQHKANDTILHLNPLFFANADKLNFLSFATKLLFDNTDNRTYPLHGIRTSFCVEKMGIVNFDNTNILNITANIQYYKEYIPRNYFNIETEINYSKSFQNVIPFPLYRPLGFEQYLRGFDNMVFSTEFYALLKTSLKYEIVPYNETVLPIIPWDQFNKFHYRILMYAFADMAYLRDYNPCISAGLGIDFVTYYDRVLSTYLAWNNINKKIGIFVQYKTPLVKQF
jgi:outer membrane protein assembly factor BamA